MRLRFDDIMDQDFILPMEQQWLSLAFAGNIGLAFQSRDESDGVGRSRMRWRGRNGEAKSHGKQDTCEESGCRHSAFQKLPLNVTEYTMRS